MFDMFVTWTGISILIMMFWIVGCAFDGDTSPTELTPLRVFFYTLLLPGTVFFGILGFTAFCSIVLGSKIYSIPVVERFFKWINKPL